jgi:hypothetical protein
MSIYLYELTTTGAISFTEFCSDENASYTTHISEATQARANLRGALKESKRTDHSEKDFLKLVKVRLSPLFFHFLKPYLRSINRFLMNIFLSYMG